MGSGSFPLAQITGPAKDNGKGARGAGLNVSQFKPKGLSHLSQLITDSDHESNQANRAISTSQLNTSPCLHTWPINVVVFHGSDREHSFQGGFPA